MAGAVREQHDARFDNSNAEGAHREGCRRHRFHAPLEIQNLPVPEPGADEGLVHIESSGLCHTDIHAAHGDWPVKPTPPFTPGHEGVGRIESIGRSVTDRVIRQRVAIAWLGYACGKCRYCIGGWETLCWG
jgi:propanol-preferring alcohol dehydrogenase